MMYDFRPVKTSNYMGIVNVRYDTQIQDRFTIHELAITKRHTVRKYQTEPYLGM